MSFFEITVYFIFFLITAGTVVLIYKTIAKRKWKVPTKDLPKAFVILLEREVIFYNNLNTDEKKYFQFKIYEFLLNVRILGIQTNVSNLDKILIASSAIIPIFQFPNWQYSNLKEVLVYPDAFNKKFQTQGPGRNILGMVGSGYMEGKMILSKRAIHNGFRNETDRKNTSIHEFIHLIDKADGNIDGIPELLLEKQYTIPWLDLISKKIDDIYANKSEINPYASTNKAEFFAEISVYFFEQPKQLEQKHPKLYELLEDIFDSNMSKKKNIVSKISIGRNSPCPCGSGKKYKKCCAKYNTNKTINLS